MAGEINAGPGRGISRTTWLLLVVGVIALVLGLITFVALLIWTGVLCLAGAMVDHFVRLMGGWNTVKKWLLGGLGVLAALLIVVIVGGWLYFRPAQPDAFYTPPDDVPAQPGMLIRSEPFTRGVPEGAQAWRVLYTTTNHDGTPAVASGLVLAPLNAVGPRPVINWTHGTTGSDPACAPSLLPDPYPFDPTIPALDQVIEQGWIFLATDYVGLGTLGPHPYLIGEGEARSALDMERAARQLPDIQMADRTVVWGHSQGGHAALWTGIIAPSYAPDVTIIGVAALAPASDVAMLIDDAKDTTIGKLISAIFLRAYSETYADVLFDELIRPGARWTVRDIGKRCMAIPSAIASIIQAVLLLQESIWAVDPSGDEALAQRIEENTPRGLIAVPVLIAQGLTDPLILPDMQAAYVEERCAAGQSIEFRTYAGLDHLSVVGPGSLLNDDIIAWTLDRLADVPPEAGCRTFER